MGIQGNKATVHEHDFLSLYAAAAAAKDPSSRQLHDAKPSQGFFLKTQDFLQPLEKPEPQEQEQRHALTGGAGRFTVSRVPGASTAAVVKAEPALWGQPAPAQSAAARGLPWTLPLAGAGQVAAAAREQPPERKRRGGGGFMDSGSRSSGGAGFDDDDGLAARREVSSSLQELAVRVDGKGGNCSGSGTDQRPNTPRSKHSATEQRRRSKINDRFQVLRELLPHSDQKRDKATFLLEVIEYIRFLQEKVQKYEASFPEWNQENANILPWSNVYFRSFWKNAQGKGQTPEDALPDPAQFIRNGSSPGLNFTGKLDDNHIMVTSAAASEAQDQVEADHVDTVSYRSAETPTNITNNVASQSQPQWAGDAGPSCADDCAVNTDILNNEQLTIDEGTISLSSQYSQELLNTLTHALQSSNIDLSQASISVQINLGKRAVKRPAAGASSSSKELIDPASHNEIAVHHQAMFGSATEEHPHATKRHKLGNT